MTTFCLCEDRISEEIGLRMAVCSLRRHCSDSPIVIYRANPNPDFAAWLGRFPSVRLIPSSPPGASSWNCKPQALLPLLDEGAEEVVWLDADLVLAGDLRRIFGGWPRDAFGVCEEYRTAPNQGSQPRTEAWELEVGRSFPRTLNSAVLRVTPAHVPLLEQWRDLLEDSGYAAQQLRPLDERPMHMWGDQDVLNALIGSTRFAGIPVRLLRTGREVVHCGSATSNTVGERLGGMVHGMPTVVHIQGAKPWVVFDPAVIAARPGRFWDRYRLIQQLSPYRAEAGRYRDEVGIPCDWLDYWTSAGRLFRLLGLGHPALCGLPFAAAGGLFKGFRKLGKNSSIPRSK